MMNIKVSCPFKTVVYYDNETKSYPICHYKNCRLTEKNDCTVCDIKSKTHTQLKKLYNKICGAGNVKPEDFSVVQDDGVPEEILITE